MTTWPFAFALVLSTICLGLGGCGFNGDGVRPSGASADAAAGRPDASPADDLAQPPRADVQAADHVGQVGDATQLRDARQPPDLAADRTVADLALPDLPSAPDLPQGIDMVVVLPDRNVSDTAQCNPADVGFVNVSQGRPTTASSEQAGGFTANLATDGDVTTRWASNATDDEWLMVDLGSSMPVRSVVLNWERAYADQYEIQLSDDGMTFPTTVQHLNGQGGIETIAIQSSGRYVRMQGIKRHSMFGYSLFEFQVFSPLPCP